jgi:hypothetical protein
MTEIRCFAAIPNLCILVFKLIKLYSVLLCKVSIIFSVFRSLLISCEARF